jgi:hypothetical protein
LLVAEWAQIAKTAFAESDNATNVCKRLILLNKTVLVLEKEDKACFVFCNF